MTLAELLALVQKQDAKVKGLRQQMADALTASQADGLSDDDKAKHLAAFDQLKPQLKAAEADLERAVALRDAEQRAEHHANGERAAAAGTPHLGVRIVDPSRPNGHRPPAQARRSGPLKLFKGRDGEATAYRAGLWVAATQFGSQAHRERYAQQFGDGDFRQFTGDDARATLSGTDNTKGGYFVPDVFDVEIIKMVEEYGVIRRLARVRGMTSDTLSVPRWNAAVTASFLQEGGQSPTQSEQGYDRVGLVAKLLGAFGKMTNMLSEDSLVDMGDEWFEAAAIAFALKEDDAGFNGDGTSTYGGIQGLITKLLAANAVSRVTATGHTSLAALTLADFWNVVGRYPSFPGLQPRWLCHKEVYAASMGPLQTAAGGTTPQDVANGGVPKFLGYPVEFVNVMPRAAAATTGTTPIVLGDLNASTVFGDRRQRKMRTGEVNDDMLKELVTMYTSERFDIVTPTVTDPKDATKAGPVVGLTLA